MWTEHIYWCGNHNLATNYVDNLVDYFHGWGSMFCLMPERDGNILYSWLTTLSSLCHYARCRWLVWSCNHIKCEADMRIVQEDSSWNMYYYCTSRKFSMNFLLCQMFLFFTEHVCGKYRGVDFCMWFRSSSQKTPMKRQKYTVQLLKRQKHIQ